MKNFPWLKEPVLVLAFLVLLIPGVYAQSAREGQQSSQSTDTQQVNGEKRQIQQQDQQARRPENQKTADQSSPQSTSSVIALDFGAAILVGLFLVLMAIVAIVAISSRGVSRREETSR